ncbi:MAG: hypothetical protein ACLTSG_14145 [Lachnospiraceae bacterium]
MQPIRDWTGLAAASTAEAAAETSSTMETSQPRRKPGALRRRLRKPR